MHVRLSPSLTVMNPDCSFESVTVLGSMTNAAGFGVVSSVVQLGPRRPMKEVLPMRMLPWTVKLWAEDMARA